MAQAACTLRRSESAWKMIVDPASVQLENVLAVYWAMDKDDLRTVDFAKDLQTISEPTTPPALRVSEGVLALPEIDGDLNDMLIHTKSANRVAPPKMLPVCTNKTGDAVDDCMLADFMLDDDDDDDVPCDPNNDDDDAESGSDIDIG